MSPRRFFCVDKLLGQLDDDVLLFGQLCTQQSDFGLRLLLARGRLSVGKNERGMVKQVTLPVIKDAGLELVFVAQVADGNFVQMMLAQKFGFVGRGTILSGTLALIFARRELRTVSLTRVEPC